MRAPVRFVVGLVAALCGAVAVGACASGPVPAPTTAASGVRAAPTVRCDGPDPVRVSSAAELTAALAAARPGTTILLADGVYPGRFTGSTPGGDTAPIVVCGSRGAVLDGGPPDGGYTVHLQGADDWQLAGFTVRGGQKGVMIDATRRAVLENLAVGGTGDEAVHLRAGSSDGVVRGLVIRDTGRREPKFGEGIYVGSAESNWCDYSACGPDRSDRNLLEGNDVAATTSEPVDIKEGTTGGILRGSRLSGAGTTAADDWVNVKGNGWRIEGNTGVDAPTDGFATHTVADGWGEDNVFVANTAIVDAAGHGFAITKRDRGNVVSCSNVVRGAGEGDATVPCTP